VVQVTFQPEADATHSTAAAAVGDHAN
jgi:hypothetical protein